MSHYLEKQEVDPHVPGAKLDHGKPRMGLMMRGFRNSLLEVAKVSTFGAKKYTPDGWVEVPDGIDRYFDAALRHLLTSSVEDKDEESGYFHLAHAAWNILAVLELLTRKGSKHE